MENKFVVVVKENLEIGKSMNALSHVIFGIGNSLISKEEAQLTKYIDKDGKIHDNISEMPIIVLKASSNKIRNLRKIAINNSIKFVDFVNTMTIGNYIEQYNLTKTKSDEEFDYWAIAMFGENKLIEECTSKFSLFK